MIWARGGIRHAIRAIGAIAAWAGVCGRGSNRAAASRFPAFVFQQHFQGLHFGNLQQLHFPGFGFRHLHFPGFDFRCLQISQGSVSGIADHGAVGPLGAGAQFAAATCYSFIFTVIRSSHLILQQPRFTVFFYGDSQQPFDSR